MLGSRGWVRRAQLAPAQSGTDSHLTYMIDIALTTELAIAAGGVQ
jgi:hypothetical protein